MTLHKKVRPPTRVFKKAKVHPSEKRGYAYSQDIRELAIENRQNGNDNDAGIVQLRGAKKYPSTRTVNRWMTRNNMFGHVRPFRRTGNNRAKREVRNRDLFLLALYRAALPKSTSAEVNAFLFEMRRGLVANNRFYSSSQITRAEQSLNLTRKRSSTSAYQAHSLDNRILRDMFWNMRYPYGIANIPARDQIDLDEAGMDPNGINRHYGKSTEGERSSQAGMYGRSGNLTILLAISGDLQNPDRWMDLFDEGGTTLERFIAFIQRILNDLGPGTPGNRKCFTMDNLNSHKNPHVTSMILNAGHRIIFRAPYHPVDGPIEYVFNTIQQILAIQMYKINNLEDLKRQLRIIVGAIAEFNSYFRHVGMIL